MLIKASCQSLFLVQRIVEMGANVNYSDEVGNTSLNEAVRCGEFEIVKFLVENGAEINEFYIDLAHSHNEFEIENYLIKNIKN